jgi:hypothetical protein
VAKRRRLDVRCDEHVWSEAIGGFSGRPLQIATSARAQLERSGVWRSLRCCPARRWAPTAPSLAGCAKLYLPITDEPASQRPFAFVLQLTRDAQNETLVWLFIAFGHRHLGAGIRSAYERAHRQLHGRCPS